MVSKKLLVVLGCSLLLLLRPSVAFGDEPNKNVLVFYSDGLTGPAAVLVNRVLRSTLREGSTSPIQVYYESLDSF
ncbi:MAG TPA: hypothetical protein VFS77_02050, partial [Pyrinomonadaceae bacterium]|nr:hypothetical protein [Pyrinomonadaceae bacterium]